MVLQNVLVGCIEFDQDVPINQHEAICFFYIHVGDHSRKSTSGGNRGM